MCVYIYIYVYTYIYIHIHIYIICICFPQKTHFQGFQYMRDHEGLIVDEMGKLDG